MQITDNGEGKLQKCVEEPSEWAGIGDFADKIEWIGFNVVQVNIPGLAIECQQALSCRQSKCYESKHFEQKWTCLDYWSEKLKSGGSTNHKIGICAWMYVYYTYLSSKILLSLLVDKSENLQGNVLWLSKIQGLPWCSSLIAIL